jgi:hypothetical protein
MCSASEVGSLLSSRFGYKSQDEAVDMDDMRARDTEQRHCRILNAYMRTPRFALQSENSEVGQQFLTAYRSHIFT